MRIGFDLRPFLKQETGVGIYFKNLLFHLAQIDRENDYYLFSCSAKDMFPRQKVPGFERGTFRHFRLPVRAVNFLWYNLGWPRLDFFFGSRLDLTHSPTPLVLPTKGKKVITICDLCFWDHPELADKEARTSFTRGLLHSLEKADGIVTISRFSREEILRHFELDERKVRAIPLGLDGFFLKNASEAELKAVRERYRLPFSFILFVGALERRKNLPLLVDALKRIHACHLKIPLLMIGKKGGDEDRVKSRVKEQGLESWVLFIDYVPEEDLRALYHLGSALVLPSRCEGFGLPVLEAMACGLPVAASDIPAVRETAGDSALYFPAESAEGMADKVLLILKDEALRMDLRQKGKRRVSLFSWEKTAAETLAFYGDVLKK